MMRSRPIGAQGLVGPVLALGCMGLSAFYGRDTERAEPAAVIDAALECGINLLDTSDSYGAGANEEAVGKAIKARRDEVLVSTKFGRGHRDRAVKDISVGHPDHVRQACEASLRRLGVEHLDLYIYHRVDPATPVEETVAAMGELVRAGKVRHLGLSEVGSHILQRAHAVAPISVVQSEYSLLTRDPEVFVWDGLRATGATLMAYSPLSRGLLAGHIRSADDIEAGDWRATAPRFQGANLEANLALVGELEFVAEQYGVSLAQLALSWLIARGAVPVQGATTPAQVKENAQAAEVVLPAEAFEDVERLAPIGVAAGERAPATYLAHVSRE